MDNNEEIKNDEQNTKKETMTKKVADLLSTVIIAVVVALLLNMFVFSLIEVNKTSMYPTLNDTDIVFLNKTAYWFGSPKSGDIIVFKRTEANNEEKNYVKRVIGVPGDTIEISDGVVYRNGIPLYEPYLQVITNGSKRVTIPENKYFVMGDNRNVSIDSKFDSFGLVDASEIMGKVVFKTKPFGKIEQYVHDYADVK